MECAVEGYRAGTVFPNGGAGGLNVLLRAVDNNLFEEKVDKKSDLWAKYFVVASKYEVCAVFGNAMAK